MSATSIITLPVSPKQEFTLTQQLPAKDKAELIHLLEQEQYANNILRTPYLSLKKLLNSQIKKSLV